MAGSAAAGVLPPRASLVVRLPIVSTPRQTAERDKLGVESRKMRDNAGRVIFMNVGSMGRYQGLNGDSIEGGGRFPKEHGYGHEIFNFQPYAGKRYGFAETPKYSIAIQRFGAQAKDAYVDDVLVVWVAKSCVIGWYKHARLYRACQPPPNGSNRIYKGDPIGYYAVAKATDCQLLLDPDDRTFPVPRARKARGGMGRYIWYPDPHRFRGFLKRLFRFIESKKMGSTEKRTKNKPGAEWQLDPRKRKKIEESAVDLTSRFYRRLKYNIHDRQDDHVGWDLEAERHGAKLLLEVKGLAGSDLCVELTPREYEHMQKFKSQYRICVVVNALSKTRTLHRFSYVGGCWQDQNYRVLNIRELVGARLAIA